MEQQLIKKNENRPGLCGILVLIMDFVANNLNLRQNVNYSQSTLEHFFADRVNWRTNGDLHLSFVLYPDGENSPRTTRDSRT